MCTWVTEMIYVAYNQYFMVLLGVREFTVPELGSGFERTGISLHISGGWLFQEIRTLAHWSGANSGFIWTLS